MDEKSVGVWITDILDAIAGLRSFVGAMSYDEYLDDLKTRYAARHALLIVSEAVRHLPASMTDRFPEIEWQNIRSIGDRLRHEYRSVDDAILWPIVKQDIDELELAARQFLDDSSGE